jgi:hypothetical protein
MALGRRVCVDSMGEESWIPQLSDGTHDSTAEYQHRLIDVRPSVERKPWVENQFMFHHRWPSLTSQSFFNTQAQSWAAVDAN